MSISFEYGGQSFQGEYLAAAFDRSNDRLMAVVEKISAKGIFKFDDLRDCSLKTVFEGLDVPEDDQRAFTVALSECGVQLKPCELR